MTAFTDDLLTSQARQFRTDLGWPVAADPVRERLVVRTGGEFDALIAPTALAERLLTALSTLLLPAPIAVRGQCATVVTQTRPSIRDLPTEVRDAHVHGVPPGGQIVLPALSQRDAWWQRPLPSRPLPPHAAVVTTLRQVIGGQR